MSAPFKEGDLVRIFRTKRRKTTEVFGTIHRVASWDDGHAWKELIRHDLYIHVPKVGARKMVDMGYNRWAWKARDMAESYPGMLRVEIIKPTPLSKGEES